MSTTTTTTSPRRHRLAVAALALIVGFGVLGSLTSAASAATVEPPAPTSRPVEDTARAADRVVAPLNTATVTANAGNIRASITLWRWTGSAWVKEKGSTTSASGTATVRTVRGGATYAWTTYKAAQYYGADGNLYPCAFYSTSHPNGVWVARGATRAIAFYDAWNTCGA